MHVVMNRVVALKVISPRLVEDERARNWFRREVLAATQLCHANIVMAYDANEIDEVLYLAMEYVEGPNLDQLVGKQGPLPIGTACAMLHKIGRALQYAHDKGMVHRDIKPANLLIPRAAPSATPEDPRAANSAPLVKVADFGLARLHGSTSNTLQLHNDKGFVGTPGYISPEQARNVHDVDIRSDLYSLGCTLYFALAGHAPFRGASPLEIVVQHVEKEAEPLTSLRPEIPPALASIVRRLMAKKPEQRFQKPADLIAELAFLQGAWSGPVSVPTVPVARPLPAGDAVPVGEPDRVLADEGSQMPATLYVPAPTVSTPQPTIVSAGGVDELDCPRFSAETSIGEDAGSPEDQPQVVVIPVDDVFRQQWRRWVEVIEAIAAGRDPGLRETAYRALHAQIMAGIGTQIRQTDADTVWQRLENLVAPWLTLDALAATDPQTIGSLVGRCRASGRQLGLTAGSRSRGIWALCAVVLFIVAALGTFLVGYSGISLNFSGLSAAALWRFCQAHPMVVIVSLVGLVSLFFAPRLLRS
jgi:hypothetical protein